jgi:hypothetical protein
VMKSPGAEDRGLRVLEGRGTSHVSMPSTLWNLFSDPAPRQGALVGIAPPRWLHHRLMSAVPPGRTLSRYRRTRTSIRKCH